MHKEIEILRRRFESDQALAKELGVSDRHLRNIKLNKHVGCSIRKLINLLLKQAGASAPDDKGVD